MWTTQVIEEDLGNKSSFNSSIYYGLFNWWENDLYFVGKLFALAISPNKGDILERHRICSSSI